MGEAVLPKPREEFFQEEEVGLSATEQLRRVKTGVSLESASSGMGGQELSPISLNLYNIPVFLPRCLRNLYILFFSLYNISLTSVLLWK